MEDSDHAPLEESLSDSDTIDHAPNAQLANDDDDDLNRDGHSTAQERHPEDGPQQSLTHNQQLD